MSTMTNRSRVQGAGRRLPALHIDRFIGLYIWAFFIAVFGFWKPDEFLTTATLHTVASEQAITALLAVAVLVPLAAGAYDLSAGATANLATVLAVWLQSAKGMSIVPAVAIAIAASMTIGALNGIAVVKLRVNSFIATLGMASIIAAVQIIVVGPTQPYPPTSATWPQLTSTTVLGFQIVVIYLLVIAAIMWWLLTRTATGRYIYAVGGNAEASRLAGVPVGRHVFLSLLLSGTIAGIAGVLYGSLYGPSLTYGQALLLPAFAAAFLGSVLLRGKFNVWGTVGAVYILATGVKGLQFVTSATWLSFMFNGVVVIAAVAFAMWRQQAASRQRIRAKSDDVHRRLADAADPAGPPAQLAPAELDRATP
jgi:ribose transport system permease protein